MSVTANTTTAVAAVSARGSRRATGHAAGLCYCIASRRAGWYAHADFLSWQRGRVQDLMPAPKKCSDELRERATRLALESGRPIAQVARDLGVHKEALRRWVRRAKAEAAGGTPSPLTTAERERLRELEREVRELRKANEILTAASVFFATKLDGTRRRSAPSSPSRSPPAWPSSSSAARSGCRARPTTSARPGGARSARSATTCCWPRSARSRPRTSRPTATASCSWRGGGGGSPSVATASSG